MNQTTTKKTHRGTKGHGRPINKSKIAEKIGVDKSELSIIYTAHEFTGFRQYKGQLQIGLRPPNETIHRANVEGLDFNIVNSILNDEQKSIEFLEGYKKEREVIIENNNKENNG